MARGGRWHAAVLGEPVFGPGCEPAAGPGIAAGNGRRRHGLVLPAARAGAVGCTGPAASEVMPACSVQDASAETAAVAAVTADAATASAASLPPLPPAFQLVDAVHQIRAPLQALRLRLETLEVMVDPDVRGVVNAAVRETVRLNGMLRGILDDAAGRRLEPPLARIDVAEVVAARCAAWGEAADRHRVELRREGTARPVVAAPGALDQIIDILLDNALRFSPAGGVIRVVCTPAGECLRVHVIDAGPGMDPVHLARGPERFRRGPGSQGTGLGLAIARDLLASCGGELLLRPADPHGLDAAAAFRLR